MNDPKYKACKGDKFWHREGRYFIEASEPVMVLRGKDVASLAAIMAYVEILMGMEGHPTVDSHIESSTERLFTFYNYQKNNADKAGVGCSQKHHSGSEKIIIRAGELLKELGFITK